MTPAHSLKTTRSSHSAQYHRHQTYSDALKNSFSPKLFYIGIVCRLLWQMPSPQRSLGHSLFKQKFSQKFLFFFVFFLCFLFFYFIKISKFALPGVMLMYERTSKDRKKGCLVSIFWLCWFSLTNPHSGLCHQTNAYPKMVVVITGLGLLLEKLCPMCWFQKPFYPSIKFRLPCTPRTIFHGC